MIFDYFLIHNELSARLVFIMGSILWSSTKIRMKISSYWSSVFWLQCKQDRLFFLFFQVRMLRDSSDSSVMLHAIFQFIQAWLHFFTWHRGSTHTLQCQAIASRFYLCSLWLVPQCTCMETSVPLSATFSNCLCCSFLDATFNYDVLLELVVCKYWQVQLRFFSTVLCVGTRYTFSITVE